MPEVAIGCSEVGLRLVSGCFRLLEVAFRFAFRLLLSSHSEMARMLFICCAQVAFMFGSVQVLLSGCCAVEPRLFVVQRLM